MLVRWSPEAAEDLQRICERIEADNPTAALRVARTIFHGCGRLGDFPRIGRESGRMHGCRELVFPPLPYIAVYLVSENAVENQPNLPWCARLAMTVPGYPNFTSKSPARRHRLRLGQLPARQGLVPVRQRRLQFDELEALATA